MQQTSFFARNRKSIYYRHARIRAGESQGHKLVVIWLYIRLKERVSARYREYSTNVKPRNHYLSDAAIGSENRTSVRILPPCGQRVTCSGTGRSHTIHLNLNNNPRRLHLADNFFSMRQKLAAGLRHNDAAPRALEQGAPEFILQRFDRMAHCALGEKQLLAREGKAARTREDDESQQLMAVQNRSYERVIFIFRTKRVQAASR